MSVITETPPDIYRYGWRDISTKMPDGTVRTRRMALTLKDCLYPEEGDHMSNNFEHHTISHYLAGAIGQALVGVAGVLVSVDLKFFWGRTDMGNHSPDIAVTFGVRDAAKKRRPSFNVVEEGVRPTVIFEIVSPNLRENDVATKLDEYYRLGIPYYVIVDQEDEDSPRTLSGYRWTPTGYSPLPADVRGWIWIDPLKLWLEAEEFDVVCYDMTGKRIMGEMELKQLAERERDRADAERIKAEQEKARADALDARIRELEAKLRDANKEQP